MLVEDSAIGAIVVYTPPRAKALPPFEGMERFVVVGDVDEDGFVPIFRVNGNMGDSIYEYVDDLTRVYS